MRRKPNKNAFLPGNKTTELNMTHSKLITTSVMILFAFFPVKAQLTAPLLQNIEARKTTTLDGMWQIIVDPLENGYYNHRYQAKENGFFTNAKANDPSDLIEYNFDEGYQLQVPGDWNTQMDKLYYYEGTLWYKRSFDYSLEENKRLFVYFGAVNYDAVVYLNGYKVGVHQGGYTSFNFEITDWVKEEDNFLVLKVNNTRKREAIPTVNTDWWNYGGITRSVHLVETPENPIQDYFIQLEKENPEKIAGWVQLAKDEVQSLTVSIPELGLQDEFTTNPEGRASISFEAKPERWSPDNPKRYEIVIRSESDELTDQIGFRTLETRDHQILLNGESIFLRGICAHEEAPFGPGRVSSLEECEVLLRWAKELGCNFIRLAHYPHSEAMVRKAEEMGILVWSEIPVYWTVLFENEGTYALAEQQLKEMISRDKNRAAVALWSVANETPKSKARLQFLSELVKMARSMDPTRLVTAALDTNSDQEGYKVIDDELGEVLDVIGINQYCGWYGGTPQSCAGQRWKTNYNKPVVISEFGGGALQGYHGDVGQRWTEEYQDAVYKYNLTMLENMDFLAGMTPWILTDFLSPRRNLHRIQNDFNRKGLISENGVKKKAFFRLQAFYKKLAEEE